MPRQPKPQSRLLRPAADSATAELERALRGPAGIEIRRAPDGTLDEVVGHGEFHLEQMADGQWWLALGEGTESVTVILTARSKIEAKLFEGEGC